MRPNESKQHMHLKREAFTFLRKWGCKNVAMEEHLPGFRGVVDVVGYFGEGAVAVEAGYCSKDRIEMLEALGYIPIHIPYTWTPKYVKVAFKTRAIEDALLSLIV